MSSFSGMSLNNMGGYSQKPRNKLKSIIIISAIIAGVALLIIILVAIFSNKKVEFEVTQLSWEYIIDIERCTTVEESDWVVPIGGRVLYTRREFHHYETYEERYYDYDEDEYYYEEYEEPVYAIKYYYEIERWRHYREVSTLGTDKNPYWGEYRLDDYERVGDLIEIYYVYGIDKNGNPCDYEINRAAWSSLNVGEQVNGEVNVFGELVSLHRS